MRRRKLECPKESLEVRLRSTETQSTHNIVVEVEGMIEIHYASLTSQGVQHRVFYRDGHPSRFQPLPTRLNCGEQTGPGVFPLVIAVHPMHIFIVFFKTIQDSISPVWEEPFRFLIHDPKYQELDIEVLNLLGCKLFFFLFSMDRQNLSIYSK